MGVFNKKQGMFAFQLPGGSEMADPEGIAREAGSLIGSGSTFFFFQSKQMCTQPQRKIYLTDGLVLNMNLLSSWQK